MIAEKLLDRLDGVRKTGAGRWRARCPAHDGKGQTLSIAEGDSGAVIVHCFAGCEVRAVVEAVGLTLTDLFPPRPTSFDKRAYRVQMSAVDALQCLEDETTAVLCMLRDPSMMDTDRMALAARRISAAVGATTPRRP